MSIGSQFLSRVLTEATKKDKKKGFEFDRSVEAMKRAMRDIGGETNLADKIAEVAAMVGIGGMYLNKPDVREGVLEAAQSLRTKAARVRAFLSIHSALSQFHGVTPIAEGKASPEEELEGNAFQQFVEEVLVTLGIPEEMVSGEAKAGVKAGLKRTVAKLRADADVRAAFVTYGRVANIKLGDGVVGTKKSPFEVAAIKIKIKEAVDTIDAKAFYVVNTDSQKILSGPYFSQGQAEKIALSKNSDDVEVMLGKELSNYVAEAKEAEGEAAPTNLKDVLASARAIMMALGVDVTDESVVRVVNDSSFSRSIKAACRDPKVKRGMAAFLRAVE